MKAFEFFAARDSRHALALLAEHGASSQLLAGGTDLLVELKSASHAPNFLFVISRADALNGKLLTGQRPRLGALATHVELMHSPIVQEIAPVPVDAAHTIGA